MRIRFLEIAQIELDEAIHFYNNEVSGLGDLFLTEVLHCLERIQVPSIMASMLKANEKVPYTAFSLRNHLSTAQR